MQLLWTIATYLQNNVEHRIEHDTDSADVVCIHYTFLNVTADLISCDLSRWWIWQSVSLQYYSFLLLI